MLDRLGRCLKLFLSSDSTPCHEFASQFGLAIFLYAKNFQNPGEIGWPARVRLNDPATGLNASGAGRHDWAQMNIANQYRSDGGVCVCVHVCVLTHACARACMMCLQYTIIIFDPG